MVTVSVTGCNHNDFIAVTSCNHGDSVCHHCNHSHSIWTNGRRSDSSGHWYYHSCVKVICLIRERQLCFYGYVVRFPEDDPAHQILTSKDPAGWNHHPGRPRVSWLSQLENYTEGWSVGPAQVRSLARDRWNGGEGWTRRVLPYLTLYWCVTAISGSVFTTRWGFP